MMTERTKESTMKAAAAYSIPMDLMIQILLKLPAKSVYRFTCVSKSWYSLIHSKQFTDTFRSLSLSRPRLVFLLDNYSEDRVVSLSSQLLVKENTLTMPKLKSKVHYMCNSVCGFICCRLLGDRFVVCNLTTGQVIDLGDLGIRSFLYDYCFMYLGYDPNRDQYKVLRLMSPKQLGSYIEQSVCTLGGGGEQSSHSWRPIETNIRYSHCLERGVCIDGVVYYVSWKSPNRCRGVLKGFDVGSEQLHDIDTPQDLDLDLLVDPTNYLGKLALHRPLRGKGFILWVLDDAKSQEWSKKTYEFPSFTDFIDSTLVNFHFAGITAAGEIIYFPRKSSEPYELLCCDVEKNMERRVRVERHSPYAINSLYPPALLCSYVDNTIFL